MGDEPMMPRMFEDLLFPLWSRVHTEVSDAEQELTLNKFDPRVVRQINRLLGSDVDTLKQAYDISEQKRALLRSREAVRALYRADESLQLDKWPALDYAYGWMVAHGTFLTELGSCEVSVSGCGSACPKLERIRKQAQDAVARAVSLHENKDEKAFRQGFLDCVDSRIGPESGGCALSLS